MKISDVSVGLALLPLLFPAQSIAQDFQLTQRGVSGHIDMPSARMLSDGDVALSFSFDDARESLSLTFQALPNLQTSLSFSEYHDVGGGITSEISSLNIKYRIVDETRYLPTISVGIDGLFANTRDASEYVVASKTIGTDVLMSLGFGWGRLGSTSDIGLGNRPAPDSGTGASIDHLFRGDAGLFGGVTWTTPIDGLALSVEYGSDTFRDEAFAPGSRFSVGADYEIAKGLTFSAYNRGAETTGFMFTFSGNPKSPYVPPDLGAGPIYVGAQPVGRTAWPGSPTNPQTLARGLSDALEEQGVRLRSFRANAPEVHVSVEPADASSWPKTIGRTTRVLSQVAPTHFTEFRISLFRGGIPTSSVVVQRASLHRWVDQPNGALGLWDDSYIADADPHAEWDWSRMPRRGFSWSVAPAVKLDVQSDDEFDAVAKIVANGRYAFSDRFYLGGALSYQIAGNQGQEPIPADPSPRSDGGSYDNSSVQLDRLWVNYRKKISPSVYSKVSAGYFEREYGGISSEVLWAPANQNVVLGAELTYARKRDYNDPFGFIDFDSVTGFGSLYWDIGYKGLAAQVDVGRYLAGDWGTTLTLSRYYPNGWTVSGYTTVTEGNIDDKLTIGGRVDIPLSWVAPVATGRKSTLQLGGNSGDFGSRVYVPDRLYPHIRDIGKQRLYDSWGDVWK